MLRLASLALPRVAPGTVLTGVTAMMATELFYRLGSFTVELFACMITWWLLETVRDAFTRQET